MTTIAILALLTMPIWWNLIAGLIPRGRMI